MRLGRLKEVDIRDVWAHEQHDFSKWLAKEENIKELSDTLNLSLTDIETEKYVGTYRCDIICRDEITGKNVLIENQLEQTNHDHLGKIITYASGLEAGVIIWIVSNARQEHSSAIEWLNNNTIDDIAFFLIEVHAYKIGDSSPAPMFKIIEQPNDFIKTTKTMARKGKLTETETRRLEFWTMFNDVIEQRGYPFKKRKATSDHWYNVAIGSSQCNIEIDLVNKDHKIRVGVWITDNKDMYDDLYEHKDEIERIVGEPLIWDRLDKKKASIISLEIQGLDFKKQDNYPELMNEIIDKVVSLKKAFAPYI